MSKFRRSSGDGVLVCFVIRSVVVDPGGRVWVSFVLYCRQSSEVGYW